MSHTRESIDQVIAERIAADPAFRDALLSDPRSALANLTGMEIPEGVTISVYEESPVNIHLVIPAAEELSEADLELVAGGELWGLYGACTNGLCGD
jgi:hypothetical protein